MTWKEILKLSPKDRDKFTALGEEYAPEEMEEGRYNRQIARSVQDMLRRKEEHKVLEEKLEANKDKILESRNPYAYMQSQNYLRLMKNNFKSDLYETYYSELRDLLKDYDIFPSR